MSDYAPWYVIAWRLLWWVPLQLARFVLCTITLVGWGPSAARGIWKDLR
jgi:hypothetical protein